MDNFLRRPSLENQAIGNRRAVQPNGTASMRFALCYTYYTSVKRIGIAVNSSQIINVTATTIK